MNKITITEVIDGVPALVFELEGTATVYDPEILAIALEPLYSAAPEESEEESALQVAKFILSHLGELLQNSDKRILEIREDEEENG